MTVETTAAKPGRQERRKAETRRRIVTAADRLFAERGYAETSIEDIATSADVAVRTIYLHFESKAAIMLSYFDAWLDAFVAEVIARPVDEPVVESIRIALDTMGEAGWTDRVEGDARPHPLVEYLGSGPADLAGHVLHRWMQVLARLTDDAAARLGPDAGPSDAPARAMAVFTLWFSAMFAAREKQNGGPVDAEATGLAILARIASGRI